MTIGGWHPGKGLLRSSCSSAIPGGSQTGGRHNKPLERDLDSFCGNECAAQEAPHKGTGLPVPLGPCQPYRVRTLCPAVLPLAPAGACQQHGQQDTAPVKVNECELEDRPPSRLGPNSASPLGPGARLSESLAFLSNWHSCLSGQH